MESLGVNAENTWFGEANKHINTAIESFIIRGKVIFFRIRDYKNTKNIDIATMNQ